MAVHLVARSVILRHYSLCKVNFSIFDSEFFRETEKAVFCLHCPLHFNENLQRISSNEVDFVTLLSDFFLYAISTESERSHLL